MSSHSVHRWAKAYREQGPEGLLAKQRPGTKPRISPVVKKRIVNVKKAHPEYGARRIADVLKRIFLMSASASSVHKTLSDAGMTTKTKPKPVKNPSKPRFFERSTPNQMWQSDIMTFPAGGAKCLSDRLYRRLFSPLHHQSGALSQPDRQPLCWRPTAGGLPNTVCPGRC